jgi:iron(III) transport system ATP-binding protein
MIYNEIKTLRLENLCKSFQNTPVVNRVSLNVNPHELLAVVGPSGCGKTTLLRLIAGLTTPNSGSIFLGSQLLSDSVTGQFVPPYKRRIGMVFQDYALWPNMRVFDNVAYPLKVKKTEKDTAARLVRETLDLVRLQNCDKRYPHQLSGGEQQRVALARALVMQPEILLLDEPLSNLDYHLRARMESEIKRIQQETNLTIIYVTHDQSEAMTLANRIAVMKQGELIQIGTPQDIYQRPANTFVARFIGLSNMLSCKINHVNGSHQAVLPDGQEIDIETLQGLPGEQVIVSIRPEDILIGSNGHGNRGTIQSVDYHGNLIRYQIAANNLKLRVESSSNAIFKQGDPIRFRIRRAVVIPED